MVAVRQVKAARALLAWSQEDLARISEVSYPTIARLEKVDGLLGGREDTVSKIIVALESAGVIFVDENGEGPGVRLRKAAPAGDHPKPIGPATDAVERMDVEIEADRHRNKKT